MLMKLYVRMSPLMAAFLLLTTIVFFAMCLWRGEIILGLQADALKNKDQEIKVVIEQYEGANKISHEYEIFKADKLQDKVYVDREVEKLCLCLATAMSVWIMMGCSHSIAQSQPLMIPANLRMPCMKIQELSDGKGSTILRWSHDTIYSHGDCSDKHKSTILLIDDYNRRLTNGN